MSYYAKVVDGIVTTIIVAEPEFFDTFVDSDPGDWVKTSFNIRGGIYYDPSTGLPHANQDEMIAADESRQRKNYAEVGGKYDRDADAFYGIKPFDNWILDTNTYLWVPPIPKPEGNYDWDVVNEQWVETPEGNG